jgi:phosphotriesterase-related protein
LMVHPGRSDVAPFEVVSILQEVGADLRRTIMCHIDRTISDRGTLRKLADTGCILEYDLFGSEHSNYRLNPLFDMPNDAQRIQSIAWLVAEGYGRQVTISHDVGHKQSLVRYGGFGYAHIVENILPRMLSRGLRESDIETLVIETPRRLLSFV